jgi:hypothetical protein
MPFPDLRGMKTDECETILKIKPSAMKEASSTATVAHKEENLYVLARRYK